MMYRHHVFAHVRHLESWQISSSRKCFDLNPGWPGNKTGISTPTCLSMPRLPTNVDLMPSLTPAWGVTVVTCEDLHQLQESWQKLSSQEQGSLLQHFLADGVVNQAIVFELPGESRRGEGSFQFMHFSDAFGAER